MLEGTLRVEAGENEIEGRAGSAILVLRGMPAHLLESRSRVSSLLANNDSQHLQPDPENPMP